MVHKTAIGVDIGGTKIAIAAVDERGSILSEEVIPTFAGEDPDETMNRMADKIKSLSASAVQPIAGIGIGAPGPLDAERGIVLSPPNLKQWYGFPLKERFDEVFGLHTVVENDPDAAVLGEKRFGSHRDTANMIYVTVSTGIGGGIIINHQLYRGGSFGAGEFGHAVVAKDGPMCSCGKRGCLGAVASGTGIALVMKDWVMLQNNHPLKKRESELTAKDVFDAWHAGDETAKKVIEEASDYLAVGLANIISSFNPSTLILGGGLILGQPDYYNLTISKIKRYSLDHNYKHVKIGKASLGEKAGVLGAASLVL